MMYSPDNIFSAYKKLKHLIYYDNVSLFYREKLAEYEYLNCVKETEDGHLDFLSFNRNEKPFQDVLMLLKGNDQNLSEWLSSNIGFHLVPKSIKKDKQDADTYLSNRLYTDRSWMDKGDFNILIDAPIPVHIISILWIMEMTPFLKDKYDCCYANILYPRTYESEDHEDNGLSLFIPYFKKYQEWRDRALNKVKSLMAEKRNATLLSLDIKKYFYNAKVNVLELTKELLKGKDVDTDHTYRIERLSNILGLVHSTYQKKVKKFLDLNNNPIDITDSFLPIGLYSSGVLGNLFLQKFDNAIVEKINPAYYGRYVDDILLVFADRKIDESHNKPVLNFIDEYLHPIFEIKASGKNSETYELQIHIPEDNDNNYSGLKIQKKKIVLENFFHNETQALIDNFKLKIDRQRSEFRFLPNEEAMNEEFDQIAFKIGYSDSVQKLRSISDFKSDRFAISSYLAKAITLALYEFGEKPNRNRGNEYSLIATQILAFFKGSECLNFWQMWEKVCSWFVITKQFKGLQKFIREVHRSIKNLQVNWSQESNKPIHKNPRSKLFLENLIKHNLCHYLDCAISMAFSLSDQDDINKFESQGLAIEKKALKFRLTNLSRHHFIGCPAINYTPLLFNRQMNLYDFDICHSAEAEELFANGLIVNEDLANLTPRCVRYHELSLLYSFANYGIPLNKDVTDGKEN